MIYFIRNYCFPKVSLELFLCFGDNNALDSCCTLTISVQVLFDQVITITDDEDIY